MPNHPRKLPISYASCRACPRGGVQKIRPCAQIPLDEAQVPRHFRAMRVSVLFAAVLICLPSFAAAQSSDPLERTISARLAASEFMRICVRTNADPGVINAMALQETWIPDAPSTITAGLNRVPDSATQIYTFTRSRATGGGRVRSDVQVIVPEPGRRDCTVEFQLIPFEDMKTALRSSGFVEEMEDRLITPPANAPARVQRLGLCEDSASYGRRDCVLLAVDPALYPLTGQLTFLKSGRPAFTQPIAE